MASARTLLTDGRAIKVVRGSIVIQTAGADPHKIRIPCRSQSEARRIRNVLMTAGRKAVASVTEGTLEYKMNDEEGKSLDPDEVYNIVMMRFVSSVDERRKKFLEGAPKVEGGSSEGAISE